MTNIKLYCTGANAVAHVDGDLTAGAVGIPVELYFDSSWDGLVKTVAFMSAHTVVTKPNVENSTTVAPEALKKGLRLYIGVKGQSVDGTVVIPTTWADCGKVISSASDIHDPVDPTPREIEQLIVTAGAAQAAAKEAVSTAKIVREDADSGKFDGKSPYVGADGMWYVWDNEAKEYACTGLYAGLEETQMQRIDEAVDAAVQDIQDEGARVKASIPADYTALVENVASLERIVESNHPLRHEHPSILSYSKSTSSGISVIYEPIAIPESGLAFWCDDENAVFSGTEACIVPELLGSTARFVLQVGRIVNNAFAVDNDLSYRYGGAALNDNGSVNVNVITQMRMFIPYNEDTKDCVVRLNLRVLSKDVVNYDAISRSTIEALTEKFWITSGTARASQMPVSEICTITGFDVKGEASTTVSTAPTGFLGDSFGAYRIIADCSTIDNIECSPWLTMVANVFERNPETRAETLVRTTLDSIHLSHPRGANFIDFTPYDNRYTAYIYIMKRGSKSDVLAANANRQSTGIYGFSEYTQMGFGRKLLSDVAIRYRGEQPVHSLPGIIPAVHRNLSLISAASHKRAAGVYKGLDAGRTRYYGYVSDFAGAPYYGSDIRSTLGYHVSGETMYSALLNPNSVCFGAYNENTLATDGSGYGVVCSTYVSLMHGLPLPHSTFSMRYADIPELERKRIDLPDALAEMRRYDILTKPEKETGHCILADDIFQHGVEAGLVYTEASTPFVRRTVARISKIGDSYKYLSRIKPGMSKEIRNWCKWEPPYSEPQDVMCSRGYGGLYLIGQGMPINLSVAPGVEQLTVSCDGVHVVTVNVPQSSSLKNGYYVVSLRDYVTAPGEYIVTGGNAEEKFYACSVGDVTFSRKIVNDHVTISCSNHERLRWVVITYSRDGVNADIPYSCNFTDGKMTVPRYIDTGADGYGQFTYVSAHVVVDSGYGINTYAISSSGAYKM